PSSEVLSHVSPAFDLRSFSEAIVGIALQNDGSLRVMCHDGTDQRVWPDGGLVPLGMLGFAVNSVSVLPDGTGFAVGGTAAIETTANGGWLPTPLTLSRGYELLNVNDVWTAPGLVASWAVGQGGMLLRYDGPA